MPCVHHSWQQSIVADEAKQTKKSSYLPASSLAPKPVHIQQENSRTRDDRLTKLLQLMQRLLAGSLSRPRMIFSCRSSSLTRLAIATGSPRHKPWNSQQSKRNHTKTPPEWPEIRASPSQIRPRITATQSNPPSLTCGWGWVRPPSVRVRARGSAGRGGK